MAAKRPELLELNLLPAGMEHGDRLVVLVHGLGTPALLDDVAELVRRALPGADLALGVYNAGLFSNIEVGVQARRLAMAIGQLLADAQKQSRPYKSIVLVGHSIGALLLRAAYLIARGVEFRNVDAIPAELRGWAEPAIVERMVLLAGLNQGWSAPGIASLGRFKMLKRLFISGLITVTELTDRARFMRSVISGGPFVHDVRMKWLELVHNQPAAEPRCIQLYGDVRGLLDDSNINDFKSGVNFKYKVLPGAGHFDLPLLTANSIKGMQARQKLLIWKNLNPFRLFRRLLFRWLVPVNKITPDTGGSRAGVLRTVLTEAWSSIPSDLPPRLPAAAPTYHHIVLLRHGIRDEAGTWMTELKTEIERLYPAGVYVDTDSFGHFSMLQFLLRGERLSRVYDFVDRYLNLRAEHWGAQFHFFGHSYGTYIGARALRDYSGCRFENVILANSVMARDFPWHEIEGSFARILNLRGQKDLVVAWFPGLFQWWRGFFFFIQWRRKERTEYLGSAGFSGFDADLNAAPRILAGGHGAGTAGEHRERIARFLIEGRNTFSSLDTTSFPVRLGAMCPPAIWFAIFALPVYVLRLAGWSPAWAFGTGAAVLLLLLHMV
jgi:pimeloyl-ACP methyl ester carboxylesterase